MVVCINIGSLLFSDFFLNSVKCGLARVNTLCDRSYSLCCLTKSKIKNGWSTWWFQLANFIFLRVCVIMYRLAYLLTVRVQIFQNPITWFEHKFMTEHETELGTEKSTTSSSLKIITFPYHLRTVLPHHPPPGVPRPPEAQSHPGMVGGLCLGRTSQDHLVGIVGMMEGWLPR